MAGSAETVRKSRLLRRSASRLAAVQALYQMELAETEVADVLAQFSTRIGR